MDMEHATYQYSRNALVRLFDVQVLFAPFTKKKKKKTVLFAETFAMGLSWSISLP